MVTVLSLKVFKRKNKYFIVILSSLIDHKTAYKLFGNIDFLIELKLTQCKINYLRIKLKFA